MDELEAKNELVRHFTADVFDRGRVEAVRRYLAPDFVNHVTGHVGVDDFERLAATIGGAPGNANVIDLLVAEGDLVVAVMTVTRTLHEELRAFGFVFPGDGSSNTVKHVHVWRVAEGTIREHWAVRDDLAMLRQLGAFDSEGAGPTRLARLRCPRRGSSSVG